MLWAGWFCRYYYTTTGYIRIRLDNLELQDAESEVSM